LRSAARAAPINGTVGAAPQLGAVAAVLVLHAVEERILELGDHRPDRTEHLVEGADVVVDDDLAGEVQPPPERAELHLFLDFADRAGLDLAVLQIGQQGREVADAQQVGRAEVAQVAAAGDCLERRRLRLITLQQDSLTRRLEDDREIRRRVRGAHDDIGVPLVARHAGAFARQIEDAHAHILARALLGLAPERARDERRDDRVARCRLIGAVARLDARAARRMAGFGALALRRRLRHRAPGGIGADLAAFVPGDQFAGAILNAEGARLVHERHRFTAGEPRRFRRGWGRGCGRRSGRFASRFGGGDPGSRSGGGGGGMGGRRCGARHVALHVVFLFDCGRSADGAGRNIACRPNPGVRVCGNGYETDFEQFPADGAPGLVAVLVGADDFPLGHAIADRNTAQLAARDHALDLAGANRASASSIVPAR
jgi:hypothetical protein